MDILYKIKFVELWRQGLAVGLSSSDSRLWAELELTGKSFVQVGTEDKPNE